MMRTFDGSVPPVTARGRAMAVSEETLHERPVIHGFRPGRWLVAFVVAFTIALAGVAAAAVWYHNGLAGRILPGVFVSGVDVGGLTPDEARASVEARYAGLSDGGVVVQSALGSTTIRYADIERGADVDAMIDEAAALGR